MIEAADELGLPIPPDADPAECVAGVRADPRASRLRDFRSYEAADVRLGPGLTVISGRNGAGKTNLLEALYFACTGRSCRTANEREVVRFGAELTRLELRVRGRARPPRHLGRLQARRAEAADAPTARRWSNLTGVDARPLVVRLPARPAGARARRAGAAPRAPGPGRRRAVAGPRRHAPRLLRGARAAQRAAGVDPRRPRLARLAAGLGRRARPPRRRADGRPRGDRRAPAPALRRARRRPRAGGRGRAALPAALEGRPTRTALAAELAERVDSDLERGFTGHGPHRDDLAFRREGRELRAYGSRGQQRLGLLALLLAEREELAAERGSRPAAAARRRDVRARRHPPRAARRASCAATARP